MADLFADGDLHFQLARVLKAHWLFDLGCDGKSNQASCSCGFPDFPRVANVGEAVETFVNHTLEEMRPYLAAALEQSAQEREAFIRQTALIDRLCNAVDAATEDVGHEGVETLLKLIGPHNENCVELLGGIAAVAYLGRDAPTSPRKSTHDSP